MQKLPIRSTIITFSLQECNNPRVLTFHDNILHSLTKEVQLKIRRATQDIIMQIPNFYPLWTFYKWKRTLICFLLCMACISVSSKTIGPDIVARARLLRDLPLSRTLQSQSRVDQRQEGHVTSIYVSISPRSLDLDVKEGVFSMNGWLSLRYIG